jgi:hypothetical protein
VATEITRTNPLASLAALAGTYTGKSLSIDVQPVGFGAGLQLIWRWGVQSRDVGLIGTTEDGRLVLSYLSNSQPWWGAGFLRWFTEDEMIIANGLSKLRFKWEATAQPSAIIERITLEFSDDRSMTFTYEMDGAKPTQRQWKLVCST